MKAQNLPHYGIARGYVRTGKRVCILPERERKWQDGIVRRTAAEFRDFPSISKAKHFMLTGDGK